MKKVGKKSIILAAMVLLLGGAVYVNWLISGGSLGLADLVNGTASDKQLGNAELVGAPADGTESEETPVIPPYADTFTELRLSRSQSRDESISVLQTVTENEGLTEEERKSAVDTLAELVDNMQAEANVENLVKAKGFYDCMAYIGTDNVTVTVAAEEPLTAAQAAQIKDIAVAETNYSAERIKIVEVG